jgi:arylsulfatase A-like enzyme
LPSSSRAGFDGDAKFGEPHEQAVVNRRQFVMAAAACGLPFVAGAKAAPARHPRGNILILSLDGGLDWKDALPPELEGLHDAGARFSSTFSATASPLAFDAVLTTGLHAHQLGRIGAIHDVNEPALLPSAGLQSAFAQAGYRTLQLGSDQLGQLPHLVLPDRNVVPWQPLFLYATIGVDPAVPAARRWSHVDAELRHVKRTFQAASVDRDTIIIVVGKPRLSKAGPIDERVELVIIDSRTPGAKTIHDLASTVDIAPTVLSWAGFEAARKALPGHSLLPLIGGNTKEARKAVYASHSFISLARYRPERSLRTRQFQLVQQLVSGPYGQVSEALFDLTSGGNRARNVIDDPYYAHVADQHRLDLQKWREQSDDFQVLS